MNQTQKHTHGKKLLALLLALIMTVSLLPMSVFATEPGAEPAPAVTQPAEDTQEPAADAAPAADTADEPAAPADETADDTADDTADVPAGEPAALPATQAGDVAVTTVADATVQCKILHLDCGRKYFSADWIKALINEMAAAGYNQLQLAFGNDGLRFLLDDMSFTANGTSYSHDAVVASVEAGNEAQNSSGDKRWLTQNEMDGIISYASDKGIKIVPLLNLPGHADAIVNIKESFKFKTSNGTLNVTDSPEAQNFALAILGKYVNYFSGKGCEFFNFGADEYANDINGNPYYSQLSNEQYSNLVSFVNSMATAVEDANMTPRAFNDSMYYQGKTSTATIDTGIQCCYWSSGWADYSVAAASTIANNGHEMINTNGDYYYVLGKEDTFDSDYSAASGFNNTAFMGSTIANPAGSMFCIWCDYPNAETETTVAQKTRLVLRAMAARMDNKSIDTISTEVVTGGFNADGSINAASVDGSDPGDSSTPTTGNTVNVNLNVGEAKTIENVNAVAGDYITDNQRYIATAKVTSTTTPGTTKYTLVNPLTAGTYYVSTSANATNPSVQLTLEAADNGTYYLKNSSGQYIYPNASYYSRGQWNYSLGTNTETEVTATASGTGFKFSRSVSSQSGWTTTTTMTLSNGAFGASNAGNVLYLYKSETVPGTTTSALTITGTGEGGTSVVVGDTTYNITVTAPMAQETKTIYFGGSFTPAGTDVTITAGTGIVSLKDGKIVAGNTAGTATVTSAEKNAGGYVTKHYTYTVTVAEENLDEVSPLTIEYWITNAHNAVKDDKGNNTYSVTATDAYGEDGLDVTFLPKTTTKDGRTLDYWRCRLLDTTLSNSSESGTEKQTETAGDDETFSGVGFTKVRYYDGAWAVYTENNEWVPVESKHQLVAYYMEKVSIENANGTTEVLAHAADWGIKGDGFSSWGYTPELNRCSVSVQLVYEDGITNPTATTATALKSKTFVYGYWDGGRGLGTMLFDGEGDYQIYKITAETGDMISTASGNNYVTVTNFSWDDNEETVWEGELANQASIHNNSRNPDYTAPYDNLTWNTSAYNKNNAILIRVYVKAVAKADSLTVNYFVQGETTPFYNYHINVKENTTFDQSFAYVAASGGNKASLTGNTVRNYYDQVQTVQYDLSTMPQIGAQYRYSDYLFVAANRSEDGKTVNLYYTFNSAKTFVVDFGLPLVIKPSDINADLAQATITGVTISTTSTYANITTNNNHEITYKLNKLIEGNDTFGVQYTGTKLVEGQSAVDSVSYTITIIPASNVYYEDSFASFASGTGAAAGATWSTDGTATSGATQALEELGSETHNVYGYDKAYDSCTTFSMGSAKKVTVSKTMADGWTEASAWPTATFTFKGTGFDVISLTDNNSGLITYEVKNSQGETEISKFVDNYYGYKYENGQFAETATSGENALYQLPVIKVSGLEYGTYTVTITAAYGEFFDKTGDNQYNFWLDAIRVYDPMGKAYDYTSDSEGYPQYFELRKALANTESGYRAVLIEGKAEANQTEYKNFGPNHEVYLAKNQTLAFKLENNLDSIASVQLGLKSVDGDATYKINEGTEQKVTTATDMYYNITSVAKSGETVLITNTGDNILSLTNVKVTFTAADKTTELALMGEETVNQAVQMVRAMYAAPVAPEVFAPERFEASWNRDTVRAGQKATLTVKTSEDVACIEVDGQIIDTYRTRTQRTGWGASATTVTYRQFTYTITAAETADYTVTAFNADNVASESITATLTVQAASQGSGLVGWLESIFGRWF